jgi:ferrous iron transport protein A
MKLTELPDGESGRVYALGGEAGMCTRLREMGFCESAVVGKIAGQKTLICELCGIRIALSDKAADHIVVEPIRAVI